MTASIDLRRRARGRALRYTARIDGETLAFERALLARTTLLRDDGTREGTPVPLGLPLEQRHAWLRGEVAPVRLFQMCDEEGRPAMQVAVRVERGARGVVTKMGCAVDPDEEREGLSLLREACTRVGELASLTVSPLRVGAAALRAFEARARSVGFAKLPAPGPTRARLLALGDRGAALHQDALSGAAAARVLLGDDELAEARALSPAAHAPWDTIVHVARARPDLLRVVGVHAPAPRGPLLAWAAAHRHGALVEIVHSATRVLTGRAAVPPGALLLGGIARWARDGGAAHVVARELEGMGAEVEAGFAVAAPLGAAAALSRETRA